MFLALASEDPADIWVGGIFIGIFLIYGLFAVLRRLKRK